MGPLGSYSFPGNFPYLLSTLWVDRPSNSKVKFKIDNQNPPSLLAQYQKKGRDFLIFNNNHLDYLTYKFFIIFAGTPPTTTIGGTSFTTIAPAATTLSCPTTIPGIIFAPAPIQDPFSKTIGLAICFLFSPNFPTSLDPHSLMSSHKKRAHCLLLQWGLWHLKQLLH